MFFNRRFAACCLVLVAASLTWGQSIRVVVNRRGDVTITGTPGIDPIQIEQLPTHEIRMRSGGVIPLEFEGEESNDFITLPGTSLSSTLRINLGDGDDSVFVTADVENISCNLGRGRDLFQIKSCDVLRDLTIDCGAGGFDDNVIIKDVLVGRNVRVNLGAGDSSNGETAKIASFEACFIIGSLTVNQTSGNAKVDMDATFAKSIRVTLGTGTDEFVAKGSSSPSLYANLGPGDTGPKQTASLEAFATDSLTLIGGSNGDEMNLLGVQVFGNSTINYGSGDDNGDIRECGFLENVSINYGSGDDNGDIRECGFLENVSINAAAGDDEVSFEFNDVAGNVSVNSSSGDDRLILVGNSASEPGNWSVNTGSGNDLLVATIFNGVLGVLEARRFSVNLGAGDDRFATTYLDGIGLDVNTQTGAPRINGSAGFDTVGFVDVAGLLGLFGGGFDPAVFFDELVDDRILLGFEAGDEFDEAELE